MKITAIKIKVLENTETKLIGTGSITIDDMFVVNDIKILTNEGVCFLAMPSRKTSIGTFRDIAHPIRSDVRHTIEELFFDLYEQAKEIGGTVSFKLSEECDSLLEQHAAMFVRQEFDIA